MNKTMGLAGMAQKGRGGDTTVAHMTPGEMVVPKEVAAMRPELVEHIRSAIAQSGGDPRKYTVGAGRINPKTGAEEFATEAEIKAAYQTQLGREPDAEGLNYWMNNPEGFSGGAFAAGVAKEKAPAAPTSLVGTVDPNVNDWYRNVGGRDADEVGAKYWTDQISAKGADAAYGEFQKGMKINEGAYAKPLGLAEANQDWTGTQSSAGTSTVDEWARNVFGRDATPEEIATYGGKSTAADAQTAYRDFVAAGTAAGGTAKNMDMLAASRLNAPRTTQPVVSPSAYGNLQQEYKPVLQREVNAKTETIEGRIGNILARDEAGNYTNDAVRQAVERATQQFAKRGLVNTSMAAQAGQEAAIAKAIEIAGPDAERYFQQGRANQDASNTFARDETQQGYAERNNVNQWNQDAWMQDRRIASDEYLNVLDQQFRDRMLTKEQAFNLRQNYVTAQDRVSQSYQRMVDTINTSQMEPEEKTAAIANAAQIRDSESAYINSIFAKQPEWQSDWLALSVQVGAAGIENINDINALATIANDPAQPADVRAKAKARLDQLAAQAPEPTPAPTPAPSQGGLAGYNGDGA